VSSEYWLRLLLIHQCLEFYLNKKLFEKSLLFNISCCVNSTTELQNFDGFFSYMPCFVDARLKYIDIYKVTKLNLHWFICKTYIDTSCSCDIPSTKWIVNLKTFQAIIKATFRKRNRENARVSLYKQTLTIPYFDLLNILKK
jgi:hypothetical protein